MGTSAVVGREADLDAIGEHLANARLVTLLGPGGVGKTSVARALIERFPDDADWVDLAAIAVDSDAKAAAIRMLGTSSVEAYAVSNADRLPLVVLDNCEHVIDTAHALAADLMAAHEGVRVLATSRVELGIGGEIRYRLAPLPVASPADTVSPAAELFLLRSRAAGATWPESTTNLAAIEAIVARLDGLPLAIELAAAQALAITPAELAKLMKQALDVLVDRSAPDRHHGSLRAVIGASYERLGDTPQQFFRRSHLSAFPSTSAWPRRWPISISSQRWTWSTTCSESRS